MAKIKIIQQTEQQRLQLEDGFRQGKSHAYRMRCRAVLLKSTGMTSEQAGVQTGMTHATNRALAALGTELNSNFAHVV